MEMYEKSGTILYVLNVLKKYSNEKHPLSSKKIQYYIEKDYQVYVESRTIRRYIQLLIYKFHYDIETYEINHKGYFIRRSLHEFNNGELSAILNTFNYSNFIPLKKATQIMEKCLDQMDIYEQEKYKNYTLSMKNTRTNNSETIKNIEKINEAIFNQKKITFAYYKYELKEQLEYTFLKNIKITPYKLIYALQKFYVIGTDENNKSLFSYRLDRMQNIVLLKEMASHKFDENEIDFFIKSNVNMLSGDMEKVEIVCDLTLLDNVIELYGKEVKLKKIDDNTFYASFYTTIKGFRYWCLRNIETVKVLSPKSLVKDIKKVIEDHC